MLAAQMGQLHTRLHQLPMADLSAATRPFLERRLAEIDQLTADNQLARLTPGLVWLQAHRPAESADNCILHLNWHPRNLLLDPGGSLSAIDWSEADIGDPHADVAMTLLLLVAGAAGPAASGGKSRWPLAEPWWPGRTFGRTAAVTICGTTGSSTSWPGRHCGDWPSIVAG
jgi:aminoglycoside phosphotransferase (APT) family kinase protein